MKIFKNFALIRSKNVNQSIVQNLTKVNPPEKVTVIYDLSHENPRQCKKIILSPALSLEKIKNFRPLTFRNVFNQEIIKNLAIFRLILNDYFTNRYFNNALNRMMNYLCTSSKTDDLKKLFISFQRDPLFIGPGKNLAAASLLSIMEKSEHYLNSISNILKCESELCVKADESLKNLEPDKYVTLTKIVPKKEPERNYVQKLNKIKCLKHETEKLTSSKTALRYKIHSKKYRKSLSCSNIMAMVKYGASGKNALTSKNTRLIMLDDAEFNKFKEKFLCLKDESANVCSKNVKIPKNIVIVNFNISQTMKSFESENKKLSTEILYADKIRLGEAIFRNEIISSKQIQKYFIGLYQSILDDPQRYQRNEDVIFIGPNFKGVEADLILETESLMYLNDLIYNTIRKESIANLLDVEDPTSTLEKTQQIPMEKLVYLSAMTKVRDYAKLEKSNEKAFEEFQRTLRVAKIISSDENPTRFKSKIPVPIRGKPHGQNMILLKNVERIDSAIKKRTFAIANKKNVKPLDGNQRQKTPKDGISIIKSAPEQSNSSDESLSGLADDYTTCKGKFKLIGNAIRTSSKLLSKKSAGKSKKKSQQLGETLKNVEKMKTFSKVGNLKMLANIASKYSMSLAINRSNDANPTFKAASEIQRNRQNNESIILNANLETRKTKAKKNDVILDKHLKTARPKELASVNLDVKAAPCLNLQVMEKNPSQDKLSIKASSIIKLNPKIVQNSEQNNAAMVEETDNKEAKTTKDDNSSSGSQKESNESHEDSKLIVDLNNDKLLVSVNVESKEAIADGQRNSLVNLAKPLAVDYNPEENLENLKTDSTTPKTNDLVFDQNLKAKLSSPKEVASINLDDKAARSLPVIEKNPLKDKLSTKLNPKNQNIVQNLEQNKLAIAKETANIEATLENKTRDNSSSNSKKESNESHEDSKLIVDLKNDKLLVSVNVESKEVIADGEHNSPVNSAKLLAVGYNTEENLMTKNRQINKPVILKQSLDTCSTTPKTNDVVFDQNLKAKLSSPKEVASINLDVNAAHCLNSWPVIEKFPSKDKLSSEVSSTIKLNPKNQNIVQILEKNKVAIAEETTNKGTTLEDKMTDDNSSSNSKKESNESHEDSKLIVDLKNDKLLVSVNVESKEVVADEEKHNSPVNSEAKQLAVNCNPEEISITKNRVPFDAKNPLNKEREPSDFKDQLSRHQLNLIQSVDNNDENTIKCKKNSAEVNQLDDIKLESHQKISKIDLMDDSEEPPKLTQELQSEQKIHRKDEEVLVDKERHAGTLLNKDKKTINLRKNRLSNDRNLYTSSFKRNIYSAKNQKREEALGLLKKLKNDVMLMKENEDNCRNFVKGYGKYFDRVSLLDVRKMLEKLVSETTAEDSDFDELLIKLRDIRIKLEDRKRTQQNILDAIKRQRDEKPSANVEEHLKEHISLSDKTIADKIINSSAKKSADINKPESIKAKEVTVNKNQVDSDKKVDILQEIKQSCADGMSVPLIKSNEVGEIIWEKIDVNNVPDVKYDFVEDFTPPLDKKNESIPSNGLKGADKPDSADRADVVSTAIEENLSEDSEIFLNRAKWPDLQLDATRLPMALKQNFTVENFGVFEFKGSFNEDENKPKEKYQFKNKADVKGETKSSEKPKQPIQMNSMTNRAENIPFRVSGRNNMPLYLKVKKNSSQSSKPPTGPNISAHSEKGPKRKFSTNSWCPFIPRLKDLIEKRKRDLSTEFKESNRPNIMAENFHQKLPGSKDLTSQTYPRLHLDNKHQTAKSNKILRQFSAIKFDAKTSLYDIKQNVKFDRDNKMIIRKKAESSNKKPSASIKQTIRDEDLEPLSPKKSQIYFNYIVKQSASFTKDASNLIKLSPVFFDKKPQTTHFSNDNAQFLQKIKEAGLNTSKSAAKLFENQLKFLKNPKRKYSACVKETKNSKGITINLHDLSKEPTCTLLSGASKKSKRNHIKNINAGKTFPKDKKIRQFKRNNKRKEITPKKINASKYRLQKNYLKLKRVKQSKTCDLKDKMKLKPRVQYHFHSFAKNAKPSSLNNSNNSAKWRSKFNQCYKKNATDSNPYKYPKTASHFKGEFTQNRILDSKFFRRMKSKIERNRAKYRDENGYKWQRNFEAEDVETWIGTNLKVPTLPNMLPFEENGSSKELLYPRVSKSIS